MKINHINLTITDVQMAKLFMGTYFGLTRLARTTDEATLVGLRDEGGFVLTLLQSKNNQEPVYPETFHIGF
ncbi:VOC family protein [Spirosoma arcticum]